MCEARPLYDAFKKYGIDNFTIEQLEECSWEILSEREQYWIDKLDTFKNGYNATRGGDGKLLYDYKEIANKYLELQNQAKTAKFFGCDTDTVRRACRNENIKILPPQEVNQKSLKPLACYKNNKKIYEFSNSIEASGKILKAKLASTNNKKSIQDNITRAAKGERKTAYGFVWKYL